MAQTFGSPSSAGAAIKPTKTQLFCNNCRQLTEWSVIKEYTYATVSGAPSLQTHEFAYGRWFAHCPKCGMPYMAGEKPMIIEGVDLLRLEGETDEEIIKFQRMTADEQRTRNARYMDYLQGVKEIARPAPVVS